MSGCGESHYYWNSQHKARIEKASNIQKFPTISEVARNIPGINVVLDDHQADYQPLMVECEGKISNQNVFVLLDHGASLSYISPKI